MWSKYGLAALALQSFAQKASAGVAKRAYDNNGPVTLTRTITHNSYYGANGTPTLVTDTETIVPTTLTSIVDGSTLFVDHTITLDCTYCDAAKASKTAQLTNTNQVPAATTGGASDSAASTGGESSGETPIPSYGGSESKTTGGQNSGQTASVSYSPAGEDSNGSGSAIPSYGGNDSNTSGGENSGQTAGGSTYPPIGTASGGESSPNETPVSEQGTPVSSIPLGTGNAAIPTPGGGIWKNTTTPAAGESGESSPGQTTGGLIVTETYTNGGGSVTTEVSEVTQIVAQPVIIVIRQVTIFTFTYALGGNCPAVQSHSSGGYIVGGQNSGNTFSGLGEACSSACYKQFETCSSAAGKNFKYSDCEDQLSNCLGSAATHTAKDSSPHTLTQDVILPPDATTGGNNYINGGGVVIKTRTLTVGEVCSIGDGSVGIVTATNVPASVTSAFDATVTSSVPMVETTKNVGVTYTNEQGSLLTSYTTMTLTVPCAKCAAGSGTQVVASETGVTSSAQGVVPSGSVPAGNGSSHYTVITMSNTVPNANGKGSTVLYSESTYAIPTAVGTGAFGTGNAPGAIPTQPGSGENSGETPGNGGGYSVPVSGETASVPALSSYGGSDSTTSQSSPEQTPGSPGSPGGSGETHYTVITMTNTVPNSNGKGSTVVYSESTYAIPTAVGTGPYGTGNAPGAIPTQPGGGENSGETPTGVTPGGGSESTGLYGQSTSENSPVETTPGSPGGSGGHTSVITLTNTVPNSNGKGSTVVYSESTYVIPTAVGTGPYGTGNAPGAIPTQPGGGENSGETPTGVTPGSGSETDQGQSTQVTDTPATTPYGGGANVPGSVTGNQGDYSTSLITMSVPGSGTHSGTISVVTMTISGGSPAGSGTGNIPGSIPTQPGGGDNSGETPGNGGGYVTSYITMTMSPTCAGCSPEQTVVTQTYQQPETTGGQNSGQTPNNGGGEVQTQYVTVTMGGQTGVVPVTKTATPSVSTVYVTREGGQNSGQTVTVGGGGVSTVYVTQEGGARTVTIGGGSDRTVTVTENGSGGGSCPTGCPASCMSEAAKTLATQTTKARETVYVTQTVNNAVNTSYPSKAKWRRALGL